MAKSIMIQGTMSNVGKSIIAAALCRIFKQDGFSCAPFKSQNMALNSYITSEGLEMGRAQVFQAEAAGIEPSVLMNPILLKPTDNVGSQIIVNGEVLGNMKAADYFKYKKQLVPDIMNAYNTLAEKYDIIVIEGAGSPAEINLKKDDIVNMGMAKMVGSPVLLAGDIDRGGVFAQLLGTLMLLEEDEKSLVKGLLINKFRGDKNILKPGLDMLKQMGGKPVAGVIPYIYCDLEDEDSLSGKLEQTENRGIIDIAVIRLPKISNFTDFDVFRQFKDVSVRYVSKVSELKKPDLIIIPGTKNTISDMKWLRESGLETAIKKLVSENIPAFGICGGYQIMGKKIEDPDCTENGGSIAGMGLLDIETVFRNEKKRTRVSGKFKNISGIFSVLSGKQFSGYEIHMGESYGIKNSMLEFSDGSTGGDSHDNIYCCYVHGIFDENGIAENIVRSLYNAKGLEYIGKGIDRKAYKEQQYDILAEEVRKNIDMDFVYKIIEEGV